MKHLRGRRHVLACGLLLLSLPGVLAQPAPAPQPAARAPDSPVRIEVNAKPIEAFDTRDTGQRRFGTLEFRGGIELTSPNRDFGGLSSLRIQADGEHFIAASDRAHWLRGRIVYSGARPVGIADAEMAAMLGPDGRPLTTRGWYDTESLAEDGGTLYVGIERVNRIVRFDYGRLGLAARGLPIPVPPGVGKLPNNAGLEALAFVPKGMAGAGTLVAISERGLDEAGNIKGFLIGGAAPGEFTVLRRDNFDVSDCTILPSGELLLLERRFTWTSGVAMRLRRIPLAALVPAAVVDGPVMLFADMGYQIDNMEAIAAHRDKGGDVVLTIMSDDNFSILQRTILLQFTLVGE